MRITPLDARKQEFGKAMRGYDCDEVRAFLNTLADEYEAVLIDNKQIRERVMEQEDKLAEYQSMERNLRDTLMTAERVMQDTKETAKREGDLILKDAEMKARGILEECRMRTEELRRELVTLRKEKETYLARFKSLAEAQIQFVETHQSDFEDLDKRLVDIVDTVVAGAVRAETRPGPGAKPTQAAPAQPTPVPSAWPQSATPHTADQPAPSVPVDGPDPFAPTESSTSGSDAGGGQDIWRDYTPGSAGSEGEETETNGISELVSDTLAEAEDPVGAQEGADDSRPETAEADRETDSVARV